MIEDLLKLRGCLYSLPGIQICLATKIDGITGQKGDTIHSMRSKFGGHGWGKFIENGIRVVHRCTTVQRRRSADHGNILIAHHGVFRKAIGEVVGQAQGLGRVACNRQGHGCDGFSFASR